MGLAPTGKRRLCTAHAKIGSHRVASVLAFGEGRKSISPRISHTGGSADAVARAAVGVADSELVVGIGVEADVGVHPHAHATAQLQARGLLLSLSET